MGYYVDIEQTARRYVDILTDAGFKAVFGDQRNKDVLIDLLNIILPYDRKVKDISYMTTELPQFSPSRKNVRLDLRCMGEDGTVFIVEMQCYRQSNFFKRCVLYAAKAYDSGSVSGDRQKYDLPPVYFIGLLAGDMQEFQARQDDEADKGPVLEYTFREKISHAVPDETIMIIFVEINRFRKELNECATLFDKWCYSLKHMGTLNSLPEELRIQAFERLFAACEIAKLSPEVKLAYEKDMITERDYYNIIETAREEGLAAGIEEGMKQGMKQGKKEGMKEGMKEGLEKGVKEGLAAGMKEGMETGRREAIVDMAKKMKMQGLEIEVICETTGLAKEEIASL